MARKPLIDILCASCGKSIGVAHYRLRALVFCNAECESIPPIKSNRNSARDDQIEAMYVDPKNYTEQAIAVQFNLSRQRISQILKARGVKP